MRLLLFMFLAFIPNASNADYLDKYSGIEIIDDDDELQNNATTGMQISQMKRRNSQKITDLILDELRLYPAHILKNSLKKIYLAKHLYQHNINIGGQARSHDKTIYLSRANTSELKEKLHHEIAHILYRKHNFRQQKQWLAINPKNFNYIGSGLKSISQGHAHKWLGKQNLEQGFISTYARASIEEDFAELAAETFTNNRKLHNKIIKYDNLEKKYELLKDFYKKIDPKLLHNF